MLEELQQSQYDDWTFSRVAEQLGGNEYLDISQELPSETEWERAQDPTQEWQPTWRCRTKRGPRAEELPEVEMPQPEGVDEELPPLPDSPVASTHRGRSRSPVPVPENDIVPPASSRRRLATDVDVGMSWWEEPGLQAHFTEDEVAFWASDTAAVAVEVPMPETRASAERALHLLLEHSEEAISH